MVQRHSLATLQQTARRFVKEAQVSFVMVSSADIFLPFSSSSKLFYPPMFLGVLLKSETLSYVKVDNVTSYDVFCHLLGMLKAQIKGNQDSLNHCHFNLQGNEACYIDYIALIETLSYYLSNRKGDLSGAICA